MILTAKKKGYRIKEVPIKWTSNPDTKVEKLKTVVNYWINLIKLKVRMKNETITH